ncbi:MAG TPA: rhodanese-like domain-containing protein [Chitinophagaceae bacterium]|nr:rhodanese-like domain-containing protein [Chitinophagaceae bacterium]
MKKNILVVIALFLITLATKSQDVIVSPQWVNDNMNDPNLIIIQPSFLKLDYDNEHIKGARYLWPDWLTANSPEGTYNPPDPKDATKVLQGLGVNKNSKIVLCHAFGDVSITARMFLTLEYLGLKGQVHYLNGGLVAWKKAGFPVTKELPVIKKGNFVASVSNPVIVDKNYVMQSLQTKSSDVVDARMKRFYDGDPTGNPRDGHISGALNLPYTDMIDSTNNIKSMEVLSKNFNAVVPDKNKEIVTYCFIGQTASVIYLTGRSLGYNVKLYDGSMQEWSRIPELPMEKTKKE